jgi:hypothetical protein
MTGAATDYGRLLQALAPGDWIAARDLVHPVVPRRGLEATVRVLRAVGYEIEQDRRDGVARFRLLRPPPPQRGRAVRLRHDRDGHRAGEEGVLLVEYAKEETALVMFLDGTSTTLSAVELDYGDGDELPFGAAERL